MSRNREIATAVGFTAFRTAEKAFPPVCIVHCSTCALQRFLAKLYAFVLMPK
jgi:hypothetical protein